MNFTVQYSSTRREVWAFYSRMWRERLWKVHSIILLIVSVQASIWLFGGWPNNVLELLGAIAIGLIPVALMALFPMMMFKPQTRTLTVDADGIATTIGRHNKRLAWTDIADVRNGDDTLIIEGRSMNAFIVPARAFATPEARISFEDFVRTQAPTTSS